jgi:hypothetical protein
MIVPGPRQARRERWARILTDWARSGQSGVEFASERGIDLHSLYRWGQRARRTALVPPSAGLIEGPPVPMAAWAAEVSISSGTVRLSAAASPRWAGQLIRELSQC